MNLPRITPQSTTTFLFSVCTIILVATPVVFNAFLNPGSKDLFSLADTGLVYSYLDNLSYASWAQQSKSGYFSYIDLYTTELSQRSMVNIYFYAVGCVSRIFEAQPYICMIAFQLCAAAAVAVTAFKLSSYLLVDKWGSRFATAFILFGSGLSWVSYTVNPLLHALRTTVTLPTGIDATYMDIFPVTEALFFPYQFTFIVLLCGALLLLAKIHDALRSDATRIPVHLCVGAGLALAVGELIRPYEPATVAIILLLHAGFVAVLQKERFRSYAACVFLVLVFVAPAALYQAYLSQLPVWRNFAHASLTIPLPFISILIGLLPWWIMSTAGILYMTRSKNDRLTFMAIWAVISTLLLVFAGGYGAKAAAGMMVPYGIMSGYAIQQLRNSSGSRAIVGRIRAKPSVFLASVIAATIFFCATPAFRLQQALRYPAPKIDAEIMQQAKMIRAAQDDATPIVLASSNIGAILPGLFGFQVYSGHWALTPDYERKNISLAKAGFDDIGHGSTFDSTELSTLLNVAKPDYAIVGINSPALQVLTANRDVITEVKGSRWMLLRFASRGHAVRQQ